MSGDRFRDYLYTYLDSLGKRPGTNRKWSISDIAKDGGPSRTTVHGWMNGAPTSPSGLRQLAHRLSKMSEEATSETGRAEAIFATVHQHVIDAVAAEAEPTAPWDFGFVEFRPISDIPAPALLTAGQQNDDDSWSFLGMVLGLYQRAAGKEIGGEQVNVAAFADVRGEPLVGFFASSDRATDWQFFHTPIRVPLNGLVLWRDLDTFARFVLPKRRRDTASVSAADCLAALRRALWRPFSGDPADAFALRPDLLPLTVENEAGRKYVTEVLGFGGGEIARRSGEADAQVDPKELLDWLIEGSDQFQAAAGSGGAVDAAQLRLPVLLIDELTCFRVLEIHGGGSLRALTDAIMISSPTDDLAPGSFPSRPRYNVTIANPRIRGGAFEVTRAALEDLLWSNVVVVAGQYVRLFHALVEVFEKHRDTGPIAPLYALYWMSIELSAEERQGWKRGQPPLDGCGGTRAITPASRDCSAWSEILQTATAILFQDERTRSKICDAIELVDATAAPGGAELRK